MYKDDNDPIDQIVMHMNSLRSTEAASAHVGKKITSSVRLNMAGQLDGFR